MRKNKICGLYVITHLPSGKFYIGSSSDVFGRVAHHKWALRRNRNNSVLLQEAFNTHPGDDTLNILIHPCVDREAAYTMEQEWVNKHWGKSQCLNTCSDVRNPIAQHLQDETVIAKREAKLLIVRNSEDYRNKMSDKTTKRWSQEGARDSIKGGGNPFAKKISVDGVVYGSVKDAVKATNVSEKTLRKRANLEAFANYCWA